MNVIHANADRMERRRRRRAGMTLIEISIVIAIIAVLTAMLVPAFRNAAGEASVKRCEALLVKIRMALSNRMDWFETSGAQSRTAIFPEQFTDASPNITPPTPANHVADTERAECLHWMVVGVGVRGERAVSEDSFSAEEIQDTDNDGLNEFVDPWGTPLRFERGSTPQVISAGPDGVFGDPSGTAEERDQSNDNIYSDQI